MQHTTDAANGNPAVLGQGQDKSVDPLEMLRSLYEKHSLGRDFADEEKFYRPLLPLLAKDLEPVYTLTRPIGLGSTATVWVVHDVKLNKARALKLARPRLSKLTEIVRIVRAETEKLAGLNHENIVKIYGAGEITFGIESNQYTFPYFVMEFIEGVKDLADYIRENLGSITGEMILTWLHDVLSGLSFLHQQRIVHCDLKPANILINPSNKSALIADLGYAKHLPIEQAASGKFTQVVYTRDYAHPELRGYLTRLTDPAATVAEVPADKLRVQFDLFALGRTMQESLGQIRDYEQGMRGIAGEEGPLLSHYEWTYLGLVAKRLLDGQVERTTANDDLRTDSIPGLPIEVLKELRYENADEALTDFEKLIHFYDLEGLIPELNPNLSNYIQIPHCHIPLTERVRNVINHPTFARLAQVSQVGFVSLVYPGATHTRFEHVLGTFAHCCEYVRALWYDQANPLFQCVMSKRDIEIALLAALIHDIAQYPMAHDLSEAAEPFAHESFTGQVLERRSGEIEENLQTVIEDAWDVKIDEVLAVIRANEGSSFRQRLLHSLIDGPIDSDKLDYLRRDSTHLGVSFGFSIDNERLLRNLTVVYHSSEREEKCEDGIHRLVWRLDVAEIGVTEKALVLAEEIWKARRNMFTQVYWHHTARTLKAMLGFIVHSILLNISTEEEEDFFWSEFYKFILKPMASAVAAEESESGTPTLSSGPLTENASQGDVSEPPDILRRDRQDGLPTVESCVSRLYPTDDALLSFLWRFSSQEAREMIQAIRRRALYSRLAVFSASYEANKSSYEVIYNAYQTYRRKADWKSMEDDRQRWEKETIRTVVRTVDKRRDLIPAGSTLESLSHEMRTVKPLILVDIPLKATWIQQSTAGKFLWYLPEDYVGVHSRDVSSFPQFRPSKLNISETDFDKEVGKIRVLAHPNWRAFLDRVLDEKEILNIICT
jgi:HD superfamily phosphohydrolase